MILTFNQGLVVPKNMFKLLHRCYFRIFIFGFVQVWLVAQKTSFIFLIENLHLSYFFVNRLHILSESLEILFKFLNQFFTTFIKRSVEQLITYYLNLMLNLIFCFRGFVLSKLSSKPLSINVVLELNNLKELFLQHFQCIFQLTVLRWHYLK